MHYTAPVSQNISRICNNMASSQSSRLNPEGPKKLNPIRDSSGRPDALRSFGLPKC